MQRCCALQGYASGYAGLMDYEARCDVNYARTCELRSGKARSVRPRVRRSAQPLSAELSASRLLQTLVLGGYFPKLVNCPKKSSISRRPLLTVLAGVKSCKRGVSREHLRKFPVKSVKSASSKDFKISKILRKISATNYEISGLLRTPRVYTAIIYRLKAKYFDFHA